MSLVYDGRLVKLYQGDVLQVLHHATWNAQTVITAPPWVRYSHAQALVDGRVPWTEADEAGWQATAVAHYVTWLPVLVKCVSDSNGRIWLIVHQSYIGAALRVAYMLSWRTPQVWTTPGSEQVIVQLGERVSRADRIAVQDALDGASNPMEDGPLLMTLIALKDGLVLDPFCGTGRTLMAAMACGMAAIGIEIREASCRQAILNLQAQERLCA